jgi:hypothetical protein
MDMPKRRDELSDHLFMLFGNLQESADAILRLPSDALKTRPGTSVYDADHAWFPSSTKPAVVERGSDNRDPGINGHISSTGLLYESSMQMRRTKSSNESLYASAPAHRARQAPLVSQKRVRWVDEPVTRAHSTERRAYSTQRRSSLPEMSSHEAQRFQRAVAAHEMQETARQHAEKARSSKREVGRAWV